MKRSLSQQEVSQASPRMKRAVSHDSAPPANEPSDSSFVHHQNKELAFDLKNKRKCIKDLRGQLTFMKQQNEAAEDLLSVLDRSYNQFNDDIAMMINILSSTNDSEVGEGQPDRKNKEWVSLLQAYLESGESYFDVTPVYDIGMMPEEQHEEDNGSGEMVNMLQLRSDDWVNTTEIESLRKQALSEICDPEILKAKTEIGKGCTTGGEMDVDVVADDDSQKNSEPSEQTSVMHDRVKNIGTELSRRTRSIKAKLHTLLKALQPKADFTSNSTASPISHHMVESRQLRAEKLLLTDLLAKYKAEIINLQAEVKLAERRNHVKERAKCFAPAGQGGAENVNSAAESVEKKEVPNGIKIDNADSVVVQKGVVSEESVPENLNISTTVNTTRKEDETEVVESNLMGKHQKIMAELKVAESRQAELELLNKVLHDQLKETEELRSIAEQSLALYIYQSVSSSSETSDDMMSKLTANQRQDMENRQSREVKDLENSLQMLQDVRQQSQKKFQDMEVEKNNLLNRVSEVELALSILTKASESQVATLCKTMSDQMDTLKKEKEAVEKSLRSAQQELDMFALVKSRLKEAEEIESTTKRQCVQLSERVVSLTKTAEISSNNLNSSRERESALVKKLTDASLKNELSVRESAVTSIIKDQQENAEEGFIPEDNIRIDDVESVKKAQEVCHQSLLTILANTEARVGEVTSELLNAKENMNDLILEIESVVNEEEKTREQNARLVKQLDDAQGSHKDMRMENLRLHQEMQEIRDSNVFVKEEKDKLGTLIQEQNEIISLLKTTEHNLRSEMHTLSGDLANSSSAMNKCKLEMEDAEIKFKRAEGATAECRQKMSDLKSRSLELNKQYDVERKKRLETERKLKQSQAMNKKLRQDGACVTEDDDSALTLSNGSGESIDNASEGNSQMLELTLNMLRCSVCHDRFKEVAITRCFHLFCKPCIDLNLSSRHRKCPACGERFGQDDVKAVYFTH